MSSEPPLSTGSDQSRLSGPSSTRIPTSTQSLQFLDCDPPKFPSITRKPQSPGLGIATTVSRALVVALVALTTALLFDGSLFAWHPTLMTLGFAGFMMEATFASVKLRTVEGPDRTSAIWNHVRLALASCVCIAAAFTAIYMNKEHKGTSHFQTWHSKLGLLTLGYTFLTPLGGVVAFRRLGITQKLPESMHWKVKWLHRNAGAMTWTLAMVVIFLGYGTPLLDSRVAVLLRVVITVLGLLVTYVRLRSPHGALESDELDGACKAV